MTAFFQNLTGQRIKDIAGAALLWAAVAYGFVRPTTQQYVFATYIGAEKSMVIAGLALLFSLLLIGIMGEKKHVRLLLVARLALNLLRMAIYPLASFEVYLDVLAMLFYFLGGLSFGLFIVAWCQYSSEKSEAEKHAVIPPSILISLSLLLVLLCLSFYWATLIASIFSIAGTLCLVLGKLSETPGDRSASKPSGDGSGSKASGDGSGRRLDPSPVSSARRVDPSPMSAKTLLKNKLSLDLAAQEPARQRRLAFLFFGIILGCLIVFCPPFVSREIPVLIFGSKVFVLAWAAIVFAIAIAFMLYVSTENRKHGVPSLLIPLIALGLVVVPFMSYGLNGIFPVSIIFVVLSQLFVFASGNPATKLVLSFWGRSFVFWERSISLIGFGIGCFSTALFISNVEIDVSYSVLIVAAFLYTTICLITISLPERILQKQSGNKTYVLMFKEVSERIARDFSLTPREREILCELAQGRNTPYIQRKLFISEGTALSHINHIHQKLGVHSRQELLDVVHHYFELE